jgi:hypothetical protein
MVINEKARCSTCLFIGDEGDKDGEWAHSAGMPYLILAPDNRERQFLQLQDRVKRCTG